MSSPFLHLDTCMFYLAFTQKLRRKLEEEALKSRPGQASLEKQNVAFGYADSPGEAKVRIPA